MYACLLDQLHKLHSKIPISDKKLWFWALTFDVAVWLFLSFEQSTIRNLIWQVSSVCLEIKVLMFCNLVKSRDWLATRYNNLKAALWFIIQTGLKVQQFTRKNTRKQDRINHSVEAPSSRFSSRVISVNVLNQNTGFYGRKFERAS